MTSQEGAQAHSSCAAVAAVGAWAGIRARGASGKGRRGGAASGPTPRRGTSAIAAAAAAAETTAEVTAEVAAEGPSGQGVEAAKEEDSVERVAHSLELLGDYSTEAHPGHCPGRFAGPGPEYDGMIHDPATGRWSLAPASNGETDAEESTALTRLSEADRVFVTKFEAEGGLALTLSNSFRRPERFRAAARRLLDKHDPSGWAVGDDGKNEQDHQEEENQEDARALDAEVAQALQESGLGPASELLEGASPIERAVLMLQAADIAEEREAVMRNVWSDVEFHGGEASNAELVSQLERQFAGQLVRTTENRLAAQEYERKNRHRTAPDGAEDRAKDQPVAREEEDGIFDIALRDCSNVANLAQKLPESELTATLFEPRNLGVALDLVGVYLKNYEIDKADLVISRVVPLCRRRGGVWLVKGLDKMSAVRMKQNRAYDALVALKEIERVVPFTPEEGWEFHDILYRNLAWCYSALDEAELCLTYTRKSVEVKRHCGIPASWFDIWDLGKGHARLGQKTNQREEMRVAYDLCCKAAEIHRTAEPSDRIMLAKILSNVGEVAMGIGDNFSAEGATGAADARHWYEQAQEPLRESYELHVAALGPMKPLSGWAAGTVAHCMVRLQDWERAREYLTMALKVECTKDSTTPGSLIELLDRVYGVQRQLEDMRGMSAYITDLEQGVAGLRARGWEERERDVFAMLLERVASAILLGDDGAGRAVAHALEVLQEAETDLAIYVGASAKAFRCGLCGKLYDEQEELEAHIKRRHSGQTHSDGIDIAPKRFGPHPEDPEALLRQIRASIRVLELGAFASQPQGPTTLAVGDEASSSPSGATAPPVAGSAVARADGDAEVPNASPAVATATEVIDAADAVSERADIDAADESSEEVIGVYQLRRNSPPFCTQLRYEPTISREPEGFLPDVLISDGDLVSLLRIDSSGHFGFVRWRKEEGWVQLRYLQSPPSQQIGSMAGYVQATGSWGGSRSG